MRAVTLRYSACSLSFLLGVTVVTLGKGRYGNGDIWQGKVLNTVTSHGKFIFKFHKQIIASTESCGTWGGISCVMSLVVHISRHT